MASRCEQLREFSTDLVEFKIPPNAGAAGRTIVDLRLPKASLITLIGRGDEFFVPDGSTVFREGDVVLALVNRSKAKQTGAILTGQACQPARRRRRSRAHASPVQP